MDSYLAFDFGASSGRAIVGTLEKGRLELEEVHRFDNGSMEMDGSLHWDMDAIMREIKEGLKKALKRHPDIRSMAIDTWGVDYALVKADGQLARMPYHYRDSRTQAVADRVFRTVSREELYSRTGTQHMEINTIFQLVAHKEERPEDFDGAKLLMMPDAIAYMLSGDMTCEYTHASTSQLLDVKNREWDMELVRKLGLPADIFTRVVLPGTHSSILSESVAEELGCPRIPVSKVASHDTESAIVAVPTGGGNWAYMSCGTWVLLGCELESPILVRKAMDAGLTNEGGLDGRILFLSNITGLWLIQEARRIWAEASGVKMPYSEIAKMAMSAEPLRFLVNPNAPDFMAPGDMPGRIRAYCEGSGQGKIPDDASLARCIYDSLALCFQEKLESLQRLTGTKFETLHAVGGGTQAGILMQLTADSLGIPVLAGPIEATAAGNILTQAMADGKLPGLQGIRQVVKDSFPIERYAPGASSISAWDAAYRRYLKLPQDS